MFNSTETAQSLQAFRLGDWHVEPSMNRLRRGDESVRLDLKSMDLLMCLVENAGEVVSTQQLVDTVWRVEVVSAGTLTSAIAELRKALGDDARNPTYIETIPKRGYRLISPASYDEAPQARFQSATDPAYTLKEIRSGTSAPVKATPKSARKIRRWQVAVVAALLVVAAVIGWQALTPAGEQAPSEIDLTPNRVAVVPFANRTGDRALDALGRRAAGRIIKGLADIDEIEMAPLNVVSGMVEGRAALGTEAQAIVHDVATATSASLVVTGFIYTTADGLEIHSILNNAVTGRAVREFDALNSTPDEIDTALDTLAGWIYVTVLEELHPFLRFGAGDRIPDAAAFREFVTGLPNLGSDPEASERLTRALEMDPEFERLRLFRAFSLWGLPRPWWQGSDFLIRPLEDRRSELTPSQQKLVDGIRWGLEGRWVGATKSFQQYMTDHPEQSVSEMTVIMSAVHANRPRTALEAFDRFRMDPMFVANGHMITCYLAARAHHLLGQHEQELNVLREFWQTQTKFYGTTSIRVHEARALAALGRIDECLEVVAEAMTEPSHAPHRYGELLVEVAAELRAHGHEEASLAMAQRALDWFARAELPPHTKLVVGDISITALELLGRHEEVYALGQRLSAAQPDEWRIWARVGVAAARTGDRSTATEISTRLSQVDEPFTMGMPSYFRAAIAAQLGDRDEAIRLLQQAASRGFRFWNDLHVTVDFDPLRDDPEFRELMRPKG